MKRAYEISNEELAMHMHKFWTKVSTPDNTECWLSWRANSSRR